MRLGILLLIPMVLGGCSSIFFNPEIDALCSGLERPIIEHVEAILQEETPERITRTGAKVVSVYEAGCP